MFHTQLRAVPSSANAVSDSTDASSALSPNPLMHIYF
jgi:hypothetical protein